MHVAEDFAWIRSRLDADPRRPLVLGINGPQGSGKTTLAGQLVQAAAAEGRRWFAFSVDDVYLPYAAQRALAARFPDDPLLAVRGAPGTHDVALGVATLDALGGTSGTVRVPRYDKAAHGGAGDRRPVGEWPAVVLPVEVVLFEGWMLGFPPQGAALRDPRLGNVDAFLPAYAAWTDRLDAMIQLRMVDPDAVIAWRMEAEAKLRAEGRGAMSDADAEAYVRRFLPLYAFYPEALARAFTKPLRVVWLDRERRRVARRSQASRQTIG